MRGIILKRTEIPEASLLLNILSETGKFEKLKIPGILKSSKRNSYFLSPATIWEFTISGNLREITVPREFKLICSPYEFNTNYTELFILADLLKPVKYLRPEMHIDHLFGDLEFVIKNWKCGNQILENSLLNYFYLQFANVMGLLHASSLCIECGMGLGDSDMYHLFSGSICHMCLRKVTQRSEELLPNSWVNFFADKNHILSEENIGEFQRDKNYRQQVLLYLKQAL